MDDKKVGEALNDKRMGEQTLRTFVDPKKVLEAKKPNVKIKTLIRPIKFYCSI